MATAFHLKQAFFNTAETVEWCIGKLIPKTFDTIVVRGISGMLIGAIVAYKMDKALVVVRKGEHTHSENKDLEGRYETTGRWIFLDDMVASGSTRQTCRRLMEQYNPSAVYAGSILYLDELCIVDTN